MDKTRSLLCFAQPRLNLLRQGFKVLEGLIDHASTTKGALSLFSAILVWFDNSEGTGITYVVYAPLDSVFQKIVSLAFVETHIKCGQRVYRQAGHRFKDCMVVVKKSIAAFFHGMGESQVSLARRGAGLAVWVEVIGYLMALDRAGDKERYLLLTGCRYLLTGRDWSDETEYHEFEAPEG